MSHLRDITEILTQRQTVPGVVHDVRGNLVLVATRNGMVEAQSDGSLRPNDHVTMTGGVARKSLVNPGGTVHWV